MKKILSVIVLIVVAFIFSACSAQDVIDEQPVIQENKSTLSMLSYISTAFLDAEKSNGPSVSTGLVNLVGLVKEDPELETEIEDELDRVNVYLDKLKSFIEHGIDDFGNIIEQESDRLEYDFMIIVQVEEKEFVLYYNIDVENEEISGIFILNDIEYSIEVENSFYDTKESEEEDESKAIIKLMVRNGSDSIIVEYENKQEENETKQSFHIIKNINNQIDSFEIEIKTEENEFVLTVTENENVYSFKAETNVDGETSYKLHYTVDGVKGQVKIIEKTNEDGETVYVYRIQEKNNIVEIELEDPDTSTNEENVDPPEL